MEHYVSCSVTFLDGKYNINTFFTIVDRIHMLLDLLPPFSVFTESAIGDLRALSIEVSYYPHFTDMKRLPRGKQHYTCK